MAVPDALDALEVPKMIREYGSWDELPLGPKGAHIWSGGEGVCVLQSNEAPKGRKRPQKGISPMRRLVF